MMKPKS